MAKTICFFNNKGGVGKTTTSSNVAAGLAQRYNKKVLYIDLDPQCNSTLLILGEEKVAECYWDNPGSAATILDVTRPMLDDELSIDFDHNYIRSSDNRFSVDLIMGHPRLSSIEDKLGEAWVKLVGGGLGPFRMTNWCSDLVAKAGDNYDYIIIDLGPSLGALNRSVLISSDYFITPMSIDIFSIIGLKNIKDWFDDWSEKYSRGVDNFLKDRTRDDMARYNIKENPSVIEGGLGYTTQTYASRKTVHGEKRPTKAYEKLLRKFDEEFIDNLGKFQLATGASVGNVLGQVPNMFSLAPIAQGVSSPIRDLKSNDGIFGAHYSQSKEYSEIFDSIACNILNKLEGQ